MAARTTFWRRKRKTAYILKEVETKDEESVYVLVEDDTELSAIGKVFAELLDDADIAF